MTASSHVPGESLTREAAPSSSAWNLGDITQTGLPHSGLTVALSHMADLWNGGNSVRAEQVLQEHPELAADPETAVRIVYEEICLREERGEQVESAEFYRRFPQWHDALAVVLDCHRLLRNVQEPAQFPAAGESLGEFRLLLELGRGALGRVFLATQPSLSDRPLVVKLSARQGQEHLSLARLQHTNIVPLYLVQDFPDQNMRALCMPYLGGATWNAILQGMKPIPPVQRTGEQIVAKLSKLQRHADELKIASGPAIGFLARSSYVDCVCWIGACLADALHYAHQRGLVHLDIKPSNVLLAGDGQPMLLDFHLACESRQLKDNTIDRLGGTKGYMSPEQCAATEALRQGAAPPKPLDSRSDIYSLGVLLYESLAGQLPDEEPNAVRRNLRQANPRVSRGLQDIVCKCLAPAPSDRYADAGQLAADLRCHMASLPLRWNANRSLAERWRKWRRRKPYAIAILIVGLAAAIVIGGVGGLFYRDRVRSAEASLLQSEREFENKDYAPAIQHAQSAWGYLHWFPWKGDLKNRISAQIAAAQHAQAVAGFHDFVEQLRFLDDQQLSDAKLAEIAAGCRRIWKDRAALAPTTDVEADAPPSAERSQQLTRDLLDLAILSARLEVRLTSPTGLTEAQRTARERLEEAKQLCGSQELLNLIERDYLPAAASSSIDAESASLPLAGDAWEHCAIGRWLMRHGRLTEAERHFSAAIDLAPDDFWAYFQQMRCNFESSHFDEALTSAKICVALAPPTHRAECYYNRALCFEALDRNADALADFGWALNLEPALAPAALARGVLLTKMQQFDKAEADLNSALAHGSRPSEVYLQLARLHLAKHELDAASQWLHKSLALDPTNDAAKSLEKELAQDHR